MTGARHVLIRRTARLAIAAAIASVGLVAVAPPSQAADRSGRPTAVVSLGDSAISGEGGGSYEAGTNGPTDFCHRSADATIHNTAVPGVAATINLACSGADSSNLTIGGPAHYTEPSQADQLVAIADTYDIKALVVQVGANDEPAFADTVLECIKQWTIPGSAGCRSSVGPSWASRLAAMAPKVSQVIADLRTVMRSAGYADSEYRFVLNSYASPVTENMRKLTHAVEGCPLKIEDARWGRTVAVTGLTDTLRTVAAGAGVAFLDLSRATEGHEACTKAVPKSQRWQNGLTTKLDNVIYGLNLHLVQESFHPTALGYQNIGRCVGELIISAAPDAACVVGADGLLHASTPAAVATT